MIYRNLVRCSVFAVVAGVTLFNASTIARGSNQKPDQPTEASLMTAGQGVPDAAVVLKQKPSVQMTAAQDTPAPEPARAPSPPRAARATKPVEKPDGQSAGNKRTNKDGSFSFENVPVGTYNLTFEAPKVSPAMAGKVEYLVIVQQIEVVGPDNPTAKTYDESRSKTARIAIAKINEGFDFTVAPPRQELGRQVNTSKSNLRGKVLLVEIGTTNVVIDQPPVKAPHQ